MEFNEFDSFKVKNKGVVKEVHGQKIYTIYRKCLDDFVVDEFRKLGGNILDNTNYEKIDWKNKIIYISGKAIKYNRLVGADGVFSKVRKDLTGKYQKMNFAIECENLEIKDAIQIDFLDNFWGYAWRIKNNRNSLIGLGNVSKKRNIDDIFLDYFNLTGSVLRRGAFLPTGDDIYLKKGNIFFVGDACGLASPIIGEGIYYAISSSYNLAKGMNRFYKVRMIKDRLMIFNHRVSRLLIYNTFLRNFFYKYYGESRIISFLIDLTLKTIL